jgi:hypothetical protein
MNQIQHPLTVRFAPDEFSFLSNLAEAHGISAGKAARMVIQTALADGRDQHRLAALEGRLDRLAAELNEKLALIASALVKEAA